MGVDEHRRQIWPKTGRLANDSFDLKSLLVDPRDRPLADGAISTGRH
jgi:hypothetical protein